MDINLKAAEAKSVGRLRKVRVVLLLFAKSEARPFAERDGVSRVKDLVTMRRTNCKEPANNPIKIECCHI